MEAIEITILSKNVIEAMQHSKLNQKSIYNMECSGIRPILDYYRERNLKSYSAAATWEFVLETRGRYEQGLSSTFQWGCIRRAAGYLEQMYDTGQISLAPLRQWEAEFNPLHQPPEDMSDFSNMLTLTYRTRQELLKFGLAQKTLNNYMYEGFDSILRHFQQCGCVTYSKGILDHYVADMHEAYLQNQIYRSKYQNIRKAAACLEEYAQYGKLEWQRIPDFAMEYVNDSHEALLKEYRHSSLKAGLLKESTIVSYMLEIRRFMRQLEARGIYSLQNISLKVIRNAIVAIGVQAPRSVSRVLQSMRSFAKFLSQAHPEFPEIAPALVGIPASHKHVFEGYSVQESQKILEAIDRSTAIGKRDYAMIMLAHGTGLRGVDIASLKYENIDWHCHEIRLIQVKTGVPIALPLEADVGNAIADYILNGRPVSDDPHIFMRACRPYLPLGARSIWSVVARHAIPAIGKRDGQKHGPHAFRRGMGARMLEAGVEPSILSDVLGHESPDATIPYMSVSIQKLKLCAGSLDGTRTIREELR